MPDPTDIGYGITCIDAHFLNLTGTASAYLVESEGRAAFVETGTALSVPHLLGALERRGLEPAAVDYVIVTHVHLDHAGGAGALMAQLPEARLVVHPRGARHMIDPGKLIAGATAVYGEDFMRENYGTIVPVPADRVIEAPDAFELDFAGRALQFLDTQGHAKHHLCILDSLSSGFFTGDTFGLSYRALDSTRGPFIFPTTTPVQFDPEAMHRSIDRLLGHQPDRMYLTHFGPVQDVERLGSELHRLIDRQVEIGERLGDGEHSEQLREALMDMFLGEVAEHGSEASREEARAVLQMDVELNAQGLEVWYQGRTG